MGEAGFLDAFVEEGEVDVDPGDEVEEVGEGLDGAELGASAAGADDGDVDLFCHAFYLPELFVRRAGGGLAGCILAGWTGWCLRGLGARGTPHRMPGTASASPLGEGEEGRPRRTVLDLGLTASPEQPPSPQPSPSRAREKERRLTQGV